MRFVSKVMLAAVVCVAIGIGPARAQFRVDIFVDENGNGRLTNTAGFNAALPFFIGPDTGPGGLPSTLHYDLLNPPGLVVGDLILLEPGGGLSDVIRFNIAPNGQGELVFYSDNTEGADDLADTPSPPGQFYPNALRLPEVGPEGNNGIIYTPIDGQPGFVAGAAGPVTYHIISDVPEPGATALLCGLATTAAGALYRRRKRA